MDLGSFSISLTIKDIDESLSFYQKLDFKPHPLAFLGYLIADEPHHRGQIILSLKQSGYPISKKAGFGIWQWGTK